jgi:hypothetical protein
VRLVAAEEFHDGRRYAVVVEMHAPPGAEMRYHPVGGDARLRFDTTTARVYEYNEGNEILWEPCPFDAPFGGSVICRNLDNQAAMTGGYGHVLVFPEGEPPDTLVTSRKTYDQTPFGFNDIRTFAALLGMLYLEDEFRELGLYYARIDGVEYGRPRHPVSVETGPGGTSGKLTLHVHPNPIRGSATATFTLERSDSVRLDVFDATGRRVLTLDLGRWNPGRGHTQLDLMVIRLSTRWGVATRPVTVLNR